jgi:hypothetical protein
MSSPYEPIHITVPGCPGDPRAAAPPIEGVVIHRGPPLHPDDRTVVDGIPCTSVARTLVDLAEVMTRDELRATFARADGLDCSTSPLSTRRCRVSNGGLRCQCSAT